MTKTQTTTDNSGNTQTVTSHTSSNDNETTVINVTNNDSEIDNAKTIDFKNDKMFVNGKEVNVKQGDSVIINNHQTIINGQSSNNEKNVKLIQVALTGKNVKIPVTYLNNLSSNFTIEQKCSENNNSYFLVDSALEPYIVKNQAASGALNLSTGNYKIQGNIHVQLYTPALKELTYNSFGNITLSCIDKSRFSLNNNGVGKIVINNIDSDKMEIYQSGAGWLTLNGTNINNLYVENTGVGKINIDVKVNQAQINNSGVGIVKAKEINVLHSEDPVIDNVINVQSSGKNNVISVGNSEKGNIILNYTDKE